MNKTVACFVGLLLCGITTTFSLAAVTIDEGTSYTRAVVYDATNNDDESISGLSSVTASLTNYSSTTTNSYSNVSGIETFSMAFDQIRGGQPFGYSYGENVDQFTTSSDSSYAVSGFFSNSAGYTQLYASLTDLTTGSLLFVNFQGNNGSASLALGNQAGNSSNSLLGSLTGTLTAGDTYKWFVVGYTQARPSTDSGATASGNVTLTLTPLESQSSAPEPATFTIMLVGIAGYAGQRLVRRRRPIKSPVSKSPNDHM